jgi:hypothetical protein
MSSEWSLPFRFSDQNFDAFLFSPMRAKCPAYLLLYFTTIKILSEEHKIRNSSIRNMLTFCLKFEHFPPWQSDSLFPYPNHWKVTNTSHWPVPGIRIRWDTVARGQTLVPYGTSLPGHQKLTRFFLSCYSFQRYKKMQCKRKLIQS